MGTDALLSEYLTKSREGAAKLERSEVAQRIEQIFDELKLPWRRDEADWAIDADVGRVSAGIDEDEEVLTFYQTINQVRKPDKKNGELYGALLRDNFTAPGACYALMDADADEPPILIVVGRLACTSLDSEEVALVLQSVFSLSAAFD